MRAASGSPGRLRQLACLGAPIILAAVVYHPLLRNYFHGDDFTNLYQIVDDAPLAWILRPAGGHLLVLRNGLFSLFHLAFGTDPVPYFAVVFATHLLNVGLLFLVALRLTGSPYLASLAAGPWGAARIDEGALGWYSVYGQVVVATLVLAVLARLGLHLRRGTVVRVAEALGWSGLLLLACTAFGVGIGIAIVFPAAALLTLGRAQTTSSARALLLALPLLVVVLWFGSHRLYGAFFDPHTQAVPSLVISFFADWRAYPVMFLHLLGVGAAALLALFVLMPSFYPTPLAYTLVGICGVLLALALIVSPPPARRLLAALLFLAAGCYGIIAAGRAGLWSSVGIPVAGANEPRYHYVGSLFLALVLGVVCAQLTARIRVPLLARDALLVAGLAAAIVLHRRSGWTIDHHNADREATEQVLAASRWAAATARPGEPGYLPNRAFGPCPLSAPLFAGWASVFVVFAPDELVQRVRFVDLHGDGIATARPGSRLAAVLVSGSERGPGGRATGTER